MAARTYLDPVHTDISDLATGSQEAGGRHVFMASRQKLPLRGEVAREGPVPDGSLPVDVFRRDSGARLGQFAAEPQSLDRLQELLDRPRRVGLGCQAESPGLVGHLVVLIPASDLQHLFGGTEGAAPGGEPVEAWRSSLPEPPDLGGGPPSATAGPEGAGPDEATPEPADGEPEEGMRYGALHLGNVVRFDADRRHRDDFVAEVRDLFRTALEGDLPSVADRLMDELPSSSRDD